MDDDYGAATYGDRIADVYDTWYGTTRLSDPQTTAGVLAELANGGPALELGIGTGRVALPLVAKGVPVHGIDASEPMVNKLRAKPGGGDIPVSIGDFADVAVEGEFSLVYVVFNTLLSLLTQQDQVRCFGNVAQRLRPAGVFVLEAFVPDLTRFDRGQRTETGEVGTDHVILDHSVHHPAEQRVDSMHIVVRASGSTLYPVKLRYAWPSELDLMAQLAGLRLRHRWGGWDRSPFTDESTGHVSVWERLN
ncbi:MAG: class I SAM-dependent methyltransferase [Actinomycetota bacterium]